MSEQQPTSSRGRVLKKTGMNDKKIDALKKIREMQDGSIKRTDQYEVEEERQIFEQIDDDEYERRQDTRKNNNFIVDDDGFGYEDKGGEMWEYEDLDQKQGGKKNRKLNKQSGAIEQFMQPTSALANKKIPLKVNKKAAKVTAGQSKDIMDGILDELDDQDIDELQEVNQVQMSANPGYKDDTQMAFNKEEELDLKYNVKTSSGAAQKRNIAEISQVDQSKKVNPFAKKTSEINSSAFESAVDKTIQEQEIDQEEINAVSQKVDEEPEQQAETALEKEWREIKEQNEAERSRLQQTPQSNNQGREFEHPLQCNDDGSLSFYWFDAHEENYGAEVYLFGKVWQPELNQFVSCSIIVKGMERTLFALPKMKGNKARGSLSAEEEKVQQDSMIIEFNDLRKTRFKHISSFKCKFVSRKYCFEMPIAHGEHKFLKIKYPAENPPLPSNLTGNTFECIFGTNQSMLELFLLKRKIKGPCWLKIKNFTKLKQQDFKHTWCKQQIHVSQPSDVYYEMEDLNKASPPMTCLSFSLKTTRSQNNTNEIAMISCLVNHDIKQDGPTDSNKMQQFTIMRKLDRKPWPFDMQQKLKSKVDSVVSLFENERQMIEALISKIYMIDPDVLLSHNLCGSVFEVIMARIQYYNIPHWSRIGRLKKQNFPTRKFDQGGYTGSSWVPRMVSCGRLLVDTFVSSKELVRETQYDLGYLAQKQLKTTRKDFDDEKISDFYLTSDRLMMLVTHTEMDTFLTYKLMLHLNILPLTKQLTNIAGNLWFRSLQNARAERNEMLLLHEFRSRKYLCPDKKVLNSKEAKKAEFGDEDQAEGKTVKGKRGKAKYGGGLVLDPKAGFYDNIVLLLDFNSLYPSIIQEYNLCFTTVDRKVSKNFDGTDFKAKKANDMGGALSGIQGEAEADESSEPEEDTVQLPSGNAATRDAILPNVLKNLVQKRRAVKAQMKQEKDQVKYQQLNIRQTALKLTANSMYGCLGFSSSRFYAQAIAALITRTGRETLLKTKDIAEGKLSFSVIYGDTDSIMINSGTTKVADAIAMGKKLKQEVNVLFKLLEIEIDGIYKSMLLLKKKKYAALIIENAGTPEQKEVTEIKGLDMVRRDWCPLSKTVGNFVLSQILSGKQREDVVLSLNEYLSGIGNGMKSGDIPLKEYIITKQLTRSPGEYSDPKSLPHVQVALRLKSGGKSDAELVNNFIPYVICQTALGKDQKKLSIGDMAWSPDEYLKSQKSQNELKIDTDWYITQQLLPPITRLIEHIEGIEVDFVAQCLGVDGKKYKFNQHASKDEDDDTNVVNPVMKTETTQKLQDRSVASLKIQCPFCDVPYDFPEIFHKTKGGQVGECNNICPTCNEMIPAEYISNRVQLFLKQLTTLYYKGIYKCREPSCQHVTRGLLNNNRCMVTGCKGRVIASTTESQANDTLRYLQGLFNCEKFINEQQVSGKKSQYKKVEEIPHRLMLDQTKSHIDEVLTSSKYNKVDLSSIFAFMGTVH